MAPPPAHLVAAGPTGHDVAGAIASTKTLHVLEARVVTAEQRSLLDCLDAQKTETTENNIATFAWDAAHLTAIGARQTWQRRGGTDAATALADLQYALRASIAGCCALH